MRVLVTGGAGYIGSVIVSRLSARGHHVVVYDDLFRGHAAAVPAGVPLVRGDVRDTAAVRAALEHGGCEAVIHMAALRITACAAEPREAMEVMCDGSFNVIDAARLEGVKKLVVASTASVYGMAESFPTRESRFSWSDMSDRSISGSRPAG